MDDLAYSDSLYPWKRPFPWVTWFLVGSTVAVFLLQLRSLHLYGEDTVGDTLAFSALAWDDHRYWTLVTYAWAHAVAIFDQPDLFWLHLVGNMIPLVCLGPLLEECLGPVRYLGLYLGGAVAAALFWFALNPASDEPIIGASGAVFALLGATGALAPDKYDLYLAFFWHRLRMSLRVFALVACGTELAQALFGWLPQIAHSAHLGGAAFGFLYIVANRFLSRHFAPPVVAAEPGEGQPPA